MKYSSAEAYNQLPPRITRYGLIGILILGALLRLIRISGRGIWYDDAFSILLSRTTFPQIVTGTAADTMPPLYYFLLHQWMLISNEIWFIRSFNILLGLLVVYLVFQFAKEFVGQNNALIASLLATISPFQIYHAQEIRMYMLLCLSLLGYLWVFSHLTINKSGSRWDWILLVLFGVAALYTHNLAVFSIISANVYLLVRREWRMLLKVITAQFIMGLAFLPWLLMVPGQIEKIQNAFWTPRPGLVELIQAGNTLLGSMPQPTVVLIIITILSLQILALLVYQGIKNLKDPIVLLLMIMSFVPGFFLFIVSYMMRPIYVPRAMILSGVCLYLLAAVLIQRTNYQGIHRKRKSLAFYLPSALIVLVSVVSLPYQYLYDQFPRSPYQKLASLLDEKCKSADCVVVHDNKLSYFPTYIYNPAIPSAYVMDVPGSHNDSLAVSSQTAMGILDSADSIQAAQNKPDVWFVTQVKAIDEASAMGLDEVPNLTGLKEIYRVIEEQYIGDLVVFRMMK